MKYILTLLLILSLFLIANLYAQQKSLDTLVEITDNEVILKYSVKIPVIGFGEITLPKGSRIKIEE